MKSWKIWLPRAFAGIVALIALGFAVPWESVQTYIFSPVSNVRDVAILWLLGVHCLVQRRLRWFGWSLLVGGAAVFMLSIVSRVYDSPVRAQPLQLGHALVANATLLFETIAIITLLMLFRLRGLRRTMQYATVTAFALESVGYFISYRGTYYGLPLAVSHTIWVTHDWLGMLAYVGLFVTTYNVAIHHEERKPLVLINDPTARVKVQCPRCMKMQEVAVGQSVCEDCGVNFQIQIEDKPCGKCGYTLRGVPGMVCSECGTPFGVKAETGAAI